MTNKENDIIGGAARVLESLLAGESRIELPAENGNEALPPEINSLLKATKELLNRFSESRESVYALEDESLKVNPGWELTLRQNDYQLDRFLNELNINKQNEEKLRLFGYLINSISESVSITDMDNNVIFVNPAFRELYGYREEEILGKSITVLRSKINHSDRVKTLTADTMNGRWEGELWNISKDGREFPIHLSTRVIRDDKGDAVALVGIATDITERKKIEESRDNLINELEASKRQIEEEAKKLSELNLQLQKSEEKLKDLNASKDKFFSIIGHDLKNPFNVLINISTFLQEEFENLSDSEKFELIDSLNKTSANTYKLLESILDWARMQTGKIAFNRDIMLIRKMFNKTIQLFETQISSKEIKIIIDAHPALVVNADKNMIATILRNLFSNAVKFTEPGGEITIRAEEREGDVIICIADTGIGLTEEDKNKLFRIDINNSEIGSSKEKGTGLGLILCREFVEKHGGTIWVESEFGKGSSFCFTIPKV
ncbi:MAG: ATP-binding protein [Syntrophothermus sp.]